MSYAHQKRVWVAELTSPYGTKGVLQRLREWPRVRSLADIPWERGPRVWNKWVVTPGRDPIQSIQIHIESYSPGAKSENHAHQNEAGFYILEGRGHEVHDGRRYEWNAGDYVIVHNSCVHQHFNDDPDRPFTVLIFKTKPLHMFHHLVFQDELEPLPQSPDVGYRPNDDYPKEEAQHWRRGTKQANYYQMELQKRPMTLKRNISVDEMRKVIHPEDMPWENSPQGLLKHITNEWMCYELNAPVVSVDAYIQEIPGGSRSGRHRHMSEEIILVLEGRGYDLHWDVDLRLRPDGYTWDIADEPSRHEWKAGDVIHVPINSVHQHFNADPGKPARLLCMRSRVYTFLGYGQYDLEQYEPAPEWNQPAAASATAHQQTP